MTPLNMLVYCGHPEGSEHAIQELLTELCQLSHTDKLRAVQQSLVHGGGKNGELSGQGLALVSPAKGLGHCSVKVGDEIGNGAEMAAFEQRPSENTTPDLNLVHPGRVLGRS
jgi:hypothetical protein